MTILNVKEVVELLHSDKRTVQRLANKGYFPKGVCGKFGRFWLFNKEKLEEFIFNTCPDS